MKWTFKSQPSSKFTAPFLSTAHATRPGWLELSIILFRFMLLIQMNVAEKWPAQWGLMSLLP